MPKKSVIPRTEKVRLKRLGERLTTLEANVIGLNEAAERGAERFPAFTRQIGKIDARVTAIEARLRTLASPPIRVRHSSIGNGSVVAGSRGVTLVNWDSGKVGAVLVTELIEEIDENDWPS